MDVGMEVPSMFITRISTVLPAMPAGEVTSIWVGDITM
jgi:hypothetical protein